MMAFLQLLFGCTATGKAEKLLALFVGPGNNGKRVLLRIICEALGSDQYSGSMRIDTLMQRKETDLSALEDMADLKGRRLVVSSEAEEGKPLSVATAKYLTGCNPIKARKLHKSLFTFMPTHKLVVDANHSPVITNSNDAVWNRVKTILFNVTIPTEEIDTGLLDKLRAELPGILTWIVQGAIRYLADGLTFPDCVQIATEAYRFTSDSFARFVEDRCVVSDSQSAQTATLWTQYQIWIRENGEEEAKLSQSAFKSRVLQLGCREHRPRAIVGKQTRTWQGIGLKSCRTAVSLKPSHAVDYAYRQ